MKIETIKSESSNKLYKLEMYVEIKVTLPLHTLFLLSHKYPLIHQVIYKGVLIFYIPLLHWCIPSESNNQAATFPHPERSVPWLERPFKLA